MAISPVVLVWTRVVDRTRLALHSYNDKCLVSYWIKSNSVEKTSEAITALRTIMSLSLIKNSQMKLHNNWLKIFDWTKQLESAWSVNYYFLSLFNLPTQHSPDRENRNRRTDMSDAFCVVHIPPNHDTSCHLCVLLWHQACVIDSVNVHMTQCSEIHWDMTEWLWRMKEKQKKYLWKGGCTLYCNTWPLYSRWLVPANV